MSAKERAVIYVDSGSDLSSMTSISSMSSSTSLSPITSNNGRRNNTNGGMPKIIGNMNAIVPHQEGLLKPSSKSLGSSNGSGNFVIKIQIGEETTMFNPVRIDVATKNGHLHRIQHHHITTTTTNACSTSTGKSILIAATSSPTSSVAEDDHDHDGSPTNSSNSGQSSPRSDMTPPPTKTTNKRIIGGGLPTLRFGSETSESDTESDISSLTDYQITGPMTTMFGSSNNHRSANIISNEKQTTSIAPKSSCPAAQYVMREILGMSLADTTLDNSNKNKLIEEQTKFVQLKNNVHQSLIKTFSGQENNNKLKSTSNGSKVTSGGRKESFSDEIKKVVQQRMQKAEKGKAMAFPSSCDSVIAQVKEVESDQPEESGIEDGEYLDKFPIPEKESMVDVMKIVKANNKIVSFTPANSDDPSCSIILDQNYFHLNEIHEFNGSNSSNESKLKKNAGGNGQINGGAKNCVKNTKTGITTGNGLETLTRNFAGYKDIFARTTKESQNQIMSDNGTIRGVKNRVRDGIATFLQTKDTKNYSEKEQGRLVVYVTSMGVVRDTFQRCQKVKQILRTLLVKFDERDCYMNRCIQDEIRERLHLQQNKNANNLVATSSSTNANDNNNISNNKKSKSDTSATTSGLSSSSTALLPGIQKQLVLPIKNTKFLPGSSNGNNCTVTSFGTNSTTTTNNNVNHNLHKNNLPFNCISLPQVFLEGQHLGDADTIEKLNETGQLRDLLRPFKSLSVLSTCDCCGGFRMLPCPICNGSKKSVHRNHFTTEFIALKCMHCDPAGLVRCDVCNSVDDYKRKN